MQQKIKAFQLQCGMVAGFAACQPVPPCIESQNAPRQKALNNRVILLRRRSLSRRGRLPQMIVEIEAIVAAIGQRDANAARRLAEAHVAAAAQAADESFTHINTHR